MTAIEEKETIMDRIEACENRKTVLEKMLEDPELHRHPDKLLPLTKEHTRLSAIVQKASEYRQVLETIEEDSRLLKETADAELKELARAEVEEHRILADRVLADLKRLLIPPDPRDGKNAILEIRAGTGGEEAALFAADLYKMYSKFIERAHWKQEVLSASPTGLGGMKEIIIAVNGRDAYGRLKFESGVHRVQRVPLTETGGRIHTSAASVVVLPEAEEVDVEIEAKDLRIDVYRSSGPGGQSVNTTDSAVRVTHLPTGIVVTCQDEKSQHKNKAKALKVLRARLYDIKRKEEEEKLAASRRSMIGSGDRSAKIRTYNFPQGRVTEHRIALTLYRLTDILAGNLDEIIDQLQLADVNEKLKTDGSV